MKGEQPTCNSCGYPVQINEHTPDCATKREAVNTKETGIKCPERHEVVDLSMSELATAFKTLGIDHWKLPEVAIKFVQSDDDAALGHVEVRADGVDVVFDQRFADPETETVLVQTLRASGKDYPGMQKTLKHELAHIAMWSVTGMERQPATRLLDEGWASLLENTNQELPVKQTKASVREGLLNEPEQYRRCLDFGKPVTFEEELNAAEYKVGQALLLWINERFGKDKMIELLKKSPLSERRNNDLQGDDFDAALLDKSIHITASEYFKLVEDTNQGKITIEKAVQTAKKWEGRQFETALLEVTKLQNIDQIREELLKWVNSDINTNPQAEDLEHQQKIAGDETKIQEIRESLVEITIRNQCVENDLESGEIRNKEDLAAEEKLMLVKVRLKRKPNLGTMPGGAFYVETKSGESAIFKPYITIDRRTIGNLKYIRSLFDFQPKREPHDQSNRPRRERAAYLIDRFLGLNMVPLTVIRKVEDNIGSLQKWIKGLSGERVNPDTVAEDEKNKLKILDFLLEQRDRGNLNDPPLKNTIIKDGQIYAIDNSLILQNPSIESWPPTQYTSKDLKGMNIPPQVIKNMKRFIANSESTQLLRKMLGELLEDVVVDRLFVRIKAFIHAIKENNTFDDNDFEEAMII